MVPSVSSSAWRHSKLWMTVGRKGKTARGVGAPDAAQVSPTVEWCSCLHQTQEEQQLRQWTIPWSQADIAKRSCERVLELIALWLFEPNRGKGINGGKKSSCTPKDQEDPVCTPGLDLGSGHISQKNAMVQIQWITSTQMHSWQGGELGWTAWLEPALVTARHLSRGNITY